MSRADKARQALLNKVTEVLGWQQPLSLQYAVILLTAADEAEVQS